ncbi:hypothetical protein BJX99DRAFT_242968 [Aspergillus californicus]
MSDSRVRRAPSLVTTTATAIAWANKNPVPSERTDLPAILTVVDPSCSQSVNSAPAFLHQSHREQTPPGKQHPSASTCDQKTHITVSSVAI